MTLRKKLKLRNELREWATVFGISLLMVLAYGIGAYFDAI